MEPTKEQLEAQKILARYQASELDHDEARKRLLLLGFHEGDVDHCLFIAGGGSDCRGEDFQRSDPS